jgi:hypothetical protein
MWLVKHAMGFISNQNKIFVLFIIILTGKTFYDRYLKNEAKMMFKFYEIFIFIHFFNKKKQTNNLMFFFPLQQNQILTKN